MMIIAKTLWIILLAEIISMLLYVLAYEKPPKMIAKIFGITAFIGALDFALIAIKYLLRGD